LSPEFIKEATCRSRKSRDPSRQYLYKSDGFEYKLIAHAPEDYKKISIKVPELMDPKRKRAYGVWSKGRAEF
jgi:hypothetical protein